MFQRNLRAIRRYLIVGLLTAAPLWITWLVVDFIFTQLSKTGAPWVAALARALRHPAPALSEWMLESWFQSALAAIVTLTALGVLGWATTRVLGQRLINAFEAFMERLPMVKAIYGGAKRFLAVVKQKPAGVQRVVLIDFPAPPLKAVGFVTRVITEQSTGTQFAVVYVPTSPNPTSGYIELVPMDRVSPTDWSVDEAMSFIITGGTSAPEHVTFGTPPAPGNASASEQQRSAAS